MQENDFEKQVHQKMGEFRLPPSKAVWEQVAMRLHEKEKKRRWLIWFPLLLAALALGSYIVFNTNTVPKQGLKYSQAANNEPVEKIVTARGDLTKSKNLSPDRGTAIEIDKVEANDSASTKQSITELSSTSTERLINKANTGDGNVEPAKKEKVSSSIILPKNSQHSSIAHKKNNLDILAGNSSRHLGDIPFKATNVQPGMEKTEAMALANVEPAEGLAENRAMELQAVDVNAIAILRDSINTSLAFINQHPVVNNKLHLNKRWQWGFSFQGGRSSMNTGSLTLNKIFSGRNDVYASAPNFSVIGNPNGTGNPTGNSVYLEPYPMRASAAFSAGAFFKKNLSRTFAISVGVNYNYYSTLNNVGARVDSSFQSGVNNNQVVDRYYRSGSTGSYTNKFHYLEVPVLLQTKLTRYWQRPLSWDLGFSMSRLIASNALHFDNTTGHYFKDNGLINKTQFNFVTGLPVKLLSAKKFELAAGPQLQYGFSRIFKNESSAGKHFLFLGLKANVLFRK